MITFGIVTTKETSHNLSKVISSILYQNIPTFEIIVIGGYPLNNPIIRWYDFDENIKKGWITKKKNMITNLSSYPIIVYTHDYLILTPNWYSEFIKFNNDWDILMNRIETLNNERAIDWMGLPYDNKYGNVLLPYDYTNIHGMYVPGNFWISKKEFMLKNLLDETLSWGESEDIEWSKRVLGGNSDKNEWLRNLTHKSLDEEIDESSITTVYKCNPNMIVKYCKPNYVSKCFYETYDKHSGNNSRNSKNTYDYLKYRN